MKPALLTVAALLLLPAQALAAPALAPLKPCYVSVGVDEETGNTISESVDVAGTGFTPNTEVGLLVDGNTAGRAVADETGAIKAAVQAPLQEKGERDFTLTATDIGQGSVVLTTKVTALTVTVSPTKAKPTQKVTISGRGFTMPGPAYAHYTRGGKDRKTVKLGTPAGPCGTFKVRRRQFPMKRPATGLWILRVDQEKKFRIDPATAFVDLEIFVRRVLRTRS
jgi:hypothetical protein